MRKINITGTWCFGTIAMEVIKFLWGSVWLLYYNIRKTPTEKLGFLILQGFRYGSALASKTKKVGSIPTTSATLDKHCWRCTSLVMRIRWVRFLHQAQKYIAECAVRVTREPHKLKLPVRLWVPQPNWNVAQKVELKARGKNRNWTDIAIVLQTIPTTIIGYLTLLLRENSSIKGFYLHFNFAVWTKFCGL